MSGQEDDEDREARRRGELYSELCRLVMEHGIEDVRFILRVIGEEDGGSESWVMMRDILQRAKRAG